MQQLLDLCCNVLNLFCGLETGDDLSLFVDEELGEVPLDVWLLLVVGVCLSQHIVEDVSDGVLHIPSCKTFLILQELIERIGIIAINLDFLKTGELRTEVQLTELMDTVIGARSLLSELVTGKVENLEALSMIFLVKLLIRRIAG